MSHTAPRTLFLFVDGLGIGASDPVTNPVFRGDSPRLASLLAEEAVQVDASLDMPGLPQSATGQTTLLTGVNAAKIMGRHVEGYPGPTLRPVIRNHNIFLQLIQRGYRSTFANAYYINDLEELTRRRRLSVTTVSSLHAFGRVRTGDDLIEGHAVYQDITREQLVARGYTGPLVQPEEAGRHLLRIGREHDFTMFEYFQTDLMAHKGTDEDVRRVLNRLDRFLDVLLSFPDEDGHLFVMISDHGNVEDATHRLHTTNPVPFVAIGQGAERLRERVRRLEDFTPALLELYPPVPADERNVGPAPSPGGVTPRGDKKTDRTPGMRSV